MAIWSPIGETVAAIDAAIRGSTGSSSVATISLAVECQSELASSYRNKLGEAAIASGDARPVA
jgi:hypothetical protein